MAIFGPETSCGGRLLHSGAEDGARSMVSLPPFGLMFLTAAGAGVFDQVNVRSQVYDQSDRVSSVCRVRTMRDSEGRHQYNTQVS